MRPKLESASRHDGLETLGEAGTKTGWQVHAYYAVGRKRFADAMEERRGKDQPGEWKAVRRGWFLGGAELREAVLELMVV